MQQRALQLAPQPSLLTSSSTAGTVTAAAADGRDKPIECWNQAGGCVNSCALHRCWWIAVRTGYPLQACAGHGR